MAGIDIKRFLNNFAQNYRGQAFVAQGAVRPQPIVTQSPSPQVQAQSPSTPQPQNVVPKSIPEPTQNMQLNTLKSMDRAVYAKEVMGFPRNVNEFIYMLQRVLRCAAS